MRRAQSAVRIVLGRTRAVWCNRLCCLWNCVVAQLKHPYRNNAYVNQLVIFDNADLVHRYRKTAGARSRTSPPRLTTAICPEEAGKKGREEIPSDYGMGNKETKNEKEVPPEVMMAESDEYLLDPPADEEPPEEPKPEPKWTEADKLADDL